MAEKKTFQRLPNDVVPSLYSIVLKPDLKNFIFSGEETVDIKVTKNTNKIILNSADLDIKDVKLKLGSENAFLTPQYDVSAEEETLALYFLEDIPAQDAQLTIVFSGELSDNLKGFYRSKSTSAAGENEKYCAVTQFEATDARRCFPCWDEPAIKAAFDITLVVDNEIKTALSNMPVKEESVVESGGQRVVKFERTPIMSTYLVALAVGDFDYVEDKDSDGVTVRVYTPVGKKEQGEFALYVATKVLPYYKQYFNIAYPLPKMDLIAIADISAGAMENWGLVTYREAYLLVDKCNTSAVNKQVVALVVGHELAHQWFGNLVTMEWWTDLWLNEGYASFVEFLCVAYLFPEYDIWTQFVTDMYCRALQLDALNSSHPIEVPVGHPKEVEEIFDDISYNKGASIIRMLHKYIGDKDFRYGMNIYLRRHQYSNTVTEHLWSALEEASGKPIRAVMSTWTKQMGFPVITVEESTQCEGNIRTLTLSQAKFSIHPCGDESVLWMVPLSFSCSTDAAVECYSAMLEQRCATFPIPNVKPDEWVKLNPGTVGFYRTRYPSDLLKQFFHPIKERTIPPLDRLGLLDDLFAFVQTGQSSTVDALQLMQAMVNEDNYTVWSNVFSCLQKLYTLLYSTHFLDLFLNFQLQLIKPVSKKLTYKPIKDESHLNTMLRGLVLNGLVKCNDTEFLAAAKDMFSQYRAGTNSIPADLRGAIYKAVIKSDSTEGFDTILELYRETDLQEEKDRLSRSFSAISQQNVVKKALIFSISQEVSPHNAVIGIISCASSPVGRDVTWEFIKDNWDLLYERFQSGGLLSRIVKYPTEMYASGEKAAEIELFFSKTGKVSGIERTIQQSLETVRNNAAWLERDQENIFNFFNSVIC